VLVLLFMGTKIIIPYYFFVCKTVRLVDIASSLRTFYGRNHDSVDCYGIFVSQMTTDMFHLSQALPVPFLVHDLSKNNNYNILKWKNIYRGSRIYSRGFIVHIYYGSVFLANVKYQTVIAVPFCIYIMGHFGINPCV
jgi:hypothetical protein